MSAWKYQNGLIVLAGQLINAFNKVLHIIDVQFNYKKQDELFKLEYI